MASPYAFASRAHNSAIVDVIPQARREFRANTPRASITPGAAFKAFWGPRVHKRHPSHFLEYATGRQLCRGELLRLAGRNGCGDVRFC
jgi:hypothetical protein